MMSCLFLLYGIVHQILIPLCRLLFGFPSHWGRPRALRRAPCATQQVSISYPPRACAVLSLVIHSCLTLWDAMGCSPPGSSVHGDSTGKNAGLGGHALLQGIFPIQGWNPGVLHCKRILYYLSPREAWCVYVCPRLSIYPTLPVPCLVSIYLFSISLSLFLLCKLVCLHRVSTSRISILIDSSFAFLWWCWHSDIHSLLLLIFPRLILPWNWSVQSCFETN